MIQVSAPLELLRSTGPHAGLASLSGELFAVWITLPRPQRTALACRDTHPGMGEEALATGIALASIVMTWHPFHGAKR